MGQMPQKVILEWYEILAACQCGLLRLLESRKNGNVDRRKHKQGRPMMENIIINLDGACAEIAVAKYFNRFWRAGVNTFGAPDVGLSGEVRHTPKEHGRLLVCPDADPGRRYFLVRGTMPEYTIVGWILAKDAMQQKWLANPNDDGPVYLVPAEELQTELKKEQVNGADETNDGTTGR